MQSNKLKHESKKTKRSCECWVRIGISKGYINVIDLIDGNNGPETIGQVSRILKREIITNGKIIENLEKEALNDKAK